MAEVPDTLEEFIDLLIRAVGTKEFTALSVPQLEVLRKYPAISLVDDADVIEASGFGEPLDSLKMEDLSIELEILFGFDQIIGSKATSMVDIYCLLRDNS